MKKYSNKQTALIIVLVALVISNVIFAFAAYSGAKDRDADKIADACVENMSYLFEVAAGVDEYRYSAVDCSHAAGAADMFVTIVNSCGVDMGEVPDGYADLYTEMRMITFILNDMCADEVIDEVNTERYSDYKIKEFSEYCAAYLAETSDTGMTRIENMAREFNAWCGENVEEE